MRAAQSRRLEQSANSASHKRRSWHGRHGAGAAVRTIAETGRWGPDKAACQHGALPRRWSTLLVFVSTRCPWIINEIRCVHIVDNSTHSRRCRRSAMLCRSLWIGHAEKLATAVTRLQESLVNCCHNNHNYDDDDDDDTNIITITVMIATAILIAILLLMDQFTN